MYIYRTNDSFLGRVGYARHDSISGVAPHRDPVPHEKLSDERKSQGLRFNHLGFICGGTPKTHRRHRDTHLHARLLHQDGMRHPPPIPTCHQHLTVHEASPMPTGHPSLWHPLPLMHLPRPPPSTPPHSSRSRMLGLHPNPVLAGSSRVGGRGV